MYFLYEKESLSQRLKSLDQPKNVSELEHIIWKVDKWNICKGGTPETFCSDVKLKSANKVDGVWRHSECDIVLDEGTSCMKCCSVLYLLAKCVDRKNALFRAKYANKIKRITNKCIIDGERQLTRNSLLNTTPRTKKHIKGLKNKLIQCEKKLSRRDKKIEVLQKSFLDVAAKKDKTIEDCIKQKEIPDEQVIKIFIFV